MRLSRSGYRDRLERRGPRAQTSVKISQCPAFSSSRREYLLQWACENWATDSGFLIETAFIWCWHSLCWPIRVGLTGLPKQVGSMGILGQ